MRYDKKEAKKLYSKGQMMRLQNHFLIGTCLLLLLTLSTQAQDRADHNKAVPADSCILELTFPKGAELSVDGRSYGAKRSLTFNGLTPGKIYISKVDVRFANGKTEQRNVFIEAGQCVRLTLQDPSIRKPELVPQTGHPWGQVTFG
jgi:hypothetical protein